MVTRELLKTELDVLQDEYLDILYKFMKSLELSVNDLRMASHIAEKESENDLKARKRKFFDFVDAHSFTLAEDYTFNREELHER